MTCSTDMYARRNHASSLEHVFFTALHSRSLAEMLRRALSESSWSAVENTPRYPYVSLKPTTTAYSERLIPSTVAAYATATRRSALCTNNMLMIGDRKSDKVILERWIDERMCRPAHVWLCLVFLDN